MITGVRNGHDAASRRNDCFDWFWNAKTLDEGYEPTRWRPNQSPKHPEIKARRGVCRLDTGGDVSSVTKSKRRGRNHQSRHDEIAAYRAKRKDFSRSRRTNLGFRALYSLEKVGCPCHGRASARRASDKHAAIKHSERLKPSSMSKNQGSSPERHENTKKLAQKDTNEGRIIIRVIRVSWLILLFSVPLGDFFSFSCLFRVLRANFPRKK